MDLATIGGLIFALVAIAVGAALEHVTLSSLLGSSAFLIVIGGTIGATIVSHTTEDLRSVPRGLRLSFSPPKQDYRAMIDLLVGLSEKARRNGLLSLQEDADQATNPVVHRGLTMAVDGADPEAVVSVMQSLSEQQANEILRGAAVFETAGGFAPTLGIMGTVMGLITIMGNLSDPDTLGPAIAVAFLATLYGLGSANLVFLPMSNKIKGIAKQQSHFNEMIIAGIEGIQAGENPRNLREKLSIYLPSGGGARGRAAAGAPAQEGA
ncbi:chemotaxis protein MotA [Symbiobacterium terraclitae]|uniref:Chemotaxis protein MotA n=1 Tax=Symbiobacterium terraclitae TaxID=557451 RepID=A0ABS4JNB4_9FIRM|nr:flagellar motor protein [Symbiobacterium terraclitae]MBP2017023.1 chemotaxis protein MotA [Symbiobacterium terraclitae]